MPVVTREEEKKMTGLTTPYASPPLAHSIEEVAKLANCGRTTVYAAINFRTLTARKIGRRTIILDEDLRRWLKALPTRQT
jgi:excisionase family DNA binding protein